MARSLLKAARCGVLVAGLALLPALLPAQSRDDDEREAPEVTKLEFHGVDAVGTDELRNSIATAESRCRNVLLQWFVCWWTKSSIFYERRYLDREELKRDLLRIRVFYWRRGWREAQVDTTVTSPKPGEVEVAFNIAENRPTIVRTQTVLYDSTLMQQKRVQRLSVLRAGNPLNLLELDSTRALLQAEMWNKGYADARVDTAIAVNEASALADVTITVVPNRRSTVGPITISGNEDVDPQTIANAVTFRTGDIFVRGDVLRSQRNLYESNLFRQATITIPTVADSVKPVSIVVSEGPHREARIGLGFNSVDFLQAQGRITHYNVFGGARRVDLDGAVGNLLARSLQGKGFFLEKADSLTRNGNEFLLPTWQVSADFRQPAWLARPENSFGIGVFAHRRAVAPVYIDRGYGGRATFTRLYKPRVPLSASYRFEVTRVQATDVFFCVNYGVCDVGQIATLRTHQRLSPVMLSGISDRSDDPFNPTKGYVARVELEHASAATISDYRYNRVFVDGAAYKRMAGRGTKVAVLAGHLRMGLVRPNRGAFGEATLHPRSRFYAGGSQSVRGYAESQLGPRVLTVPPEQLARIPGCNINDVESVRDCDPNAARDSGGPIADDDFSPRPVGGTSVIEGSVEYRFPVWKKVGGAVFLDAAVVGQNRVESLGDIGALVRGSAAVTPGFGVRYRSPVGAIRVDVGINPKVRERLPVVTEVVVDGESRVVALREQRIYSTVGDARGLQGVLQRLTIHLSIGQAY